MTSAPACNIRGGPEPEKYPRDTRPPGWTAKYLAKINRGKK